MGDAEAMKRRLDEVYRAIERLSGDDDEKARLRGRARRYQNACGCALSGLFLIVSIATCGAGLVLADPFRWSLVAIGIAFIFCAGFLGKAIGIGWARARLRLLHRSLMRRLAI
jgi:hypothetical protein